ncbi:MAG: Mth938-like domain-containing protein, partial [bacterium]
KSRSRTFCDPYYMKIDEFKFGRISVDGKYFDDDIILMPPELKCPWWRKEGHTLFAADMVEILRYRPEIIVVGTGVAGHMDVPAGTITEMKSAGMEVEVLLTEGACARFNELKRADRKVAAALHITC